MSGEGPQQVAAGGIPQLERAVTAGANKGLALGIEGEGKNVGTRV